jgi:hypothetical protein
MTPGMTAFAPSAPVSGSVGGVLPFSNNTAPQVTEDARLAASQNQPVIAGLSGHIKTFWNQANQGKRTVELAMLEAMYARRGEYTAERVAKIAKSKQPLIYMMLAASKMRQVEALLRDVLLGSGTEKPWTLRPTPNADLPPEEVAKLVAGLQEEIQMVMAAGITPTMEQVRERLRAAKDQMTTRVQEEARIRCERMERKMEDQMAEGGLIQALDQFITDLSTFKTAFLKGPVVRNKPQLSWGDDGQLNVGNALTMEWERADPFNIYPAPWARHIGEGPLIEKHKLTREDLNQMIGVEGYDEAAIRKVIEEYGRSGLKDWLTIDSQVAAAEGKDQLSVGSTTELIDALQYWGSASGQMLVDWGMDKKLVPDLTKEYQIEAWLIGSYVIKAVLNADPLARRPYYAYSFQMIPGSVWGNSPYDLMHDCQDMCNAAARALAANLGIASGPQVAVISNRLPAGEDITEMFPWKIWQFESDPMGGTAPPITFFQPQSNAAELMTVYEKFSQLADEYTGIPRYMSGFQGGDGGAGRTASGMSMMIGNASKIIKQVLGGIDTHVITKLLERQYYYNMRYLDDPDLKGDVKVVARGATSLQVKETAQVRRNEFLAATANPIDMQIIGLDGRGEVLREAAKSLDMNTDKVVPPMIVLKEKQAIAAAQQAAQQEAELMQQQNAAETGARPSAGGAPKGMPSQPKPPGSGQRLVNGAPVADNFQAA